MFIFASFKVQSRLKTSRTQDEDFDYSDNLHQRQLWDQGEKKKELRQLFYNCHGNSLASTDFHFSFTKIKTKQKTSKQQVLKWTC